MAVTAAVFRSVEVHDLDEDRVWDRRHRAVLDALTERGVLDVSRVVLDSAHVQAKKGEVGPGRAPWTGVSPVPSPVRPRGLPVAVAVSRGNEHDSQGLKPLISTLFA